MFGRGIGGRGKGRGLRGGVCTSKQCVCPNCGYSMEVGAGKPCRSVKCPKCGTPLMRGG